MTVSSTIWNLPEVPLCFLQGWAAVWSWSRESSLVVGRYAGKAPLRHSATLWHTCCSMTSSTATLGWSLSVVARLGPSWGSEVSVGMSAHGAMSSSLASWSTTFVVIVSSIFITSLKLGASSLRPNGASESELGSSGGSWFFLLFLTLTPFFGVLVELFFFALGARCITVKAEKTSKLKHSAPP